MSSNQKVIKYVAMAFGIILAVTIISAMASAAFGLVSVLAFSTRDNTNVTDFNESYVGVTTLDISNSAGEINIISSDHFEVIATNVPDRFNCTLSNGKLTVNNKQLSGIHLFGWRNGGYPIITVYLPDDKKLDKVSISNGAGKTTAESIYAEDFYLDTGAGASYIDSLKTDKAKVNAGVGEISLKSAIVGGLDIDSGVGHFYMNGELNGDADINGGVGSIELVLKSSASDYSYDVNTGVGSIVIDGKSVSDGNISAKNPIGDIKIDGGVGKVSIEFEK